MSLEIGTRLGAHEVIGLIGKGGMGEVYRARDMKLKRQVAIKILPDEFSRDPDRLSRFQREAEVLASLNHPNIAAIYDLEEAGGTRYLVLELVDGENLAERILRGPIPVDEGLRIAQSICEALEAAHEKGIVHRDLKPANVKIASDGKVKVLDFGLAKAFDTGPATTTFSNSPTMVSGSLPGIIVGTAAYMSPEQARGRTADQRSDVFAFGCVLFEMLTGRQAFQGEDVSDVLASVIKTEPDFNALPANLNPQLNDLLRRCLAKNRQDRWHAIGDVRLEIEAIVDDPHGLKLQPAREIPKPPLWQRAVPFVILAVLVAAVAVAATLALVHRPSLPPAGVTRFPFVLPEGQRFSTTARNLITISPDGRNIVYVANQQLYLRSLGEMTARPIQGTLQNAGEPFFSPDGQWIGFFSRSDGKLKKTAITGGGSVPICDVGEIPPYGPVWNSDSYVYLGQAKRIARVSADGGKLETVIALKDGEVAHRPQLLPGGDALLFTLTTAVGGPDRWDTGQIVVQSMRTGERDVVVRSGSDGRYYVPSGHVIYTLGTSVLMMPVDASHLPVAGGPWPVIEGVMRADRALGGGADGQFAFSNNGVLAYVTGPSAKANELTVVDVDRAGVRKPLNIPPRPYSGPRVSPDGKRLAISSDDGKDEFVSIYDLDGSTPMRRLTFEGHDGKPLWTQDGQRVVFLSRRDPEIGLFWQRADGGVAEPLATKFEKGVLPQPELWTPAGRLLFSERGRGNDRASIGMLSLNADQKPTTVIRPSASNPSLSTDGRWLAYHSFEGSGFSVYVQPFPPTGEKHQIAVDGSSPLWSPDGTQLFYLGGFNETNRQIMAVDIQTTRGFVSGKATPLPIQGVVSLGPRPYDITPDGKHFIVLVPKAQGDSDRTADQINITLNWFEDLKQRMPVR